jgi:hypothetical protein
VDESRLVGSTVAVVPDRHASWSPRRSTAQQMTGARHLRGAVGHDVRAVLHHPLNRQRRPGTHRIPASSPLRAQAASTMPGAHPRASSATRWPRSRGSPKSTAGACRRSATRAYGHGLRGHFVLWAMRPAPPLVDGNVCSVSAAVLSLLKHAAPFNQSSRSRCLFGPPPERSGSGPLARKVVHASMAVSRRRSTREMTL